MTIRAAEGRMSASGSADSDDTDIETVEGRDVARRCCDRSARRDSAQRSRPRHGAKYAEGLGTGAGGTVGAATV